MRKKFEFGIEKQSGNITLFLALVLTLIFSLLFSLLEASRIEGLAALAKRNLQLRLESTFGWYHLPLWENYGLLFLDGSNEEGRFDVSMLEGRMMEEDALEQRGASFYQMALKDMEISGYLLATDEKGTVFQAQACKAAKEQIGADILEEISEQTRKGKELINDRKKNQEKWNLAKDAAASAEAIEAQGESQKEVVKEKQDSEWKQEETGSVQTEKELPENPMDVVNMWKSSPILAMVVENPSQISSKTVSNEDNLEERKKEVGNLTGLKKEVLDKLWFIQYLNYYFSCQNGAGEGGSKTHALDYELEYCIGGKSSDQENLERTVKELLLLREAGNFTTIMQDSKKQALALEMAITAVGFTGIAPLIQAVQIGILLAWSYIESVLDVRCLLAGGKVPLVKTVSEWKSDIFSGKKALEEKTEKPKDDRGLTYREYLQILLLTVKQERLAYRAMDIMEKNTRMVSGEEHFSMDHLIQGIEAKALYGANSLFLAFVPGVNIKDGGYEFHSRRQFYYSCQ
ncbi:hypothetical protein C806_00471 [Lachnospiraceae bacterium 3-1]|nr:hypothetical protein C806_00471 [Lachnospiraceae bacterium 3-1]